MSKTARKRPLPSIERVRELFSYNPESGELTWKPRPAATRNCTGYLQVCFDGQILYVHRLAWVLTHGRWPAKLIDHRDGNRSNNRINNLREASSRQNAGNQRLSSRNKSGIKGVHFDKRRGKWLASVSKNNSSIFGGYFDSKEEAAVAYAELAATEFGEFSRPERAHGHSQEQY